MVIKLKNEFYENITLIDNPDNFLVLVNKNNKLYEKFVPANLEEIDLNYSIGKKLLRKEAKDAFQNLCYDAKRLGFNIKAESTYRNYDYQKMLYQSYVTKYGLKYADNCSARPGHSEHQTGLSVDVRGSTGDYNDFGITKEFALIKNNAHKYGFILRYPKGKENITGFKYEPWHYRYIGNSDIAKYIYENNLTLEEYLMKK